MRLVLGDAVKIAMTMKGVERSPTVLRGCNGVVRVGGAPGPLVRQLLLAEVRRRRRHRDAVRAAISADRRLDLIRGGVRLQMKLDGGVQCADIWSESQHRGRGAGARRAGV